MEAGEHSHEVIERAWDRCRQTHCEGVALHKLAWAYNSQLCKLEMELDFHLQGADSTDTALFHIRQEGLQALATKTHALAATKIVEAIAQWTHDVVCQFGYETAASIAWCSDGCGIAISPSNSICFWWDDQPARRP